MMMSRSSFSWSASLTRREQYSTAASGSWREQGPQTTRRRSSRCLMTSMASLRPFRTVGSEAGGAGSSEVRSCGGMRGS